MNFAQIGVSVIVFFVANNLVKNLIKRKSYSFNEKFEEYLKEWAKLNKYLIDTSEIDKPKGNENKRSIQMICKHSNILKCNDASNVSYRKGSFLYLPKKEEFGENGKKEGSIIEFKINKSMFEDNNEVFNNYENQVDKITSKISTALKIEFAELNLDVDNKGDRIIVDFKKIKRTDENAKRLIDVVEFVKTIFLAIA